MGFGGADSGETPDFGLSQENPDSIGSPPEFTGPYAGGFSNAWQKVDNELSRSILADGVITAQEISELKQTYMVCLIGSGFSDVEIGQNGEESLTIPEAMKGDPERANEAVSQCASDTGWFYVADLYWSMAGNPDNEDMFVIMSECLVRIGLKPSGYTPDQYKLDLEQGVFDRIEVGSTDAEKFHACNLDPAHAT
jgi:hypothetical protein